MTLREVQQRHDRRLLVVVGVLRQDSLHRAVVLLREVERRVWLVRRVIVAVLHEPTQTQTRHDDPRDSAHQHGLRAGVAVAVAVVAVVMVAAVVAVVSGWEAALTADSVVLARALNTGIVDVGTMTRVGRAARERPIWHSNPVPSVTHT